MIFKKKIMIKSDPNVHQNVPNCNIKIFFSVEHALEPS